MAELHSQHDSQDPRDAVPPRLAEDLAGVFGPSPAVPPGVDWVILARAKASFARRQRFALLLRWGGGAAAVAAVVLLCVWVGGQFRGRPGAPPLAAQSRSEDSKYDLNHDGKVDILDAYFLARQIESGRALERAWDVNGDGAVDQKDVEEISRQAVSLARGRVQ